MLRLISYLLFVSLSTQCNGQEKKGKSINMQSQIEQFNKQKNRLEFKEEKLFYNDIQVKLDQNMAYYNSIFGQDYNITDRDRIIEYKNLPISINKGKDDQVDNIRIQLYYYNKKMLGHKRHNETWGFPPKILDNEYILIDGVPLNKDTDINVFNDMLIDSKNRPFKNKFKGANSIERGYLGKKNIYISLGELSNLDYIMYSDGSTTSD
jgi:hypothetical protein